jgi:GTP-binding protein EngB required for normal cell division
MLFLLPVGVPLATIRALIYGIHYPALWFSGILGTYFETLQNYINIVSNADYSKISKPYIENCGSYEKEIFDAINRGKYKNDETDNVLQTILLNRHIRNIFQADFQFAIIGKKKLGKSTFLETIIPSANANASAIEGTVEIKPFKITERVTLNDYPHFDSTDSSHKIQFMFTCKLIDHIFFVCDAKERLDADGTIEIFDIIKNSCGDNFTIILNKCDEYIKESKLNDYEKVLEDLKTSVLNRIGDRYEKNLIFTYLEKIGFESNLSLVDKMNRTNILMKDKLCKTIYDIMEKQIPDEEEFVPIKNNIAELANSKYLRPNHKIISIKYDSSESRYIIKFNDTFKNPEEHDLIETFETLVNKLKRIYKLTNPVIRPMLPKTTGNSENKCKEEEIIISTLEDFIDKTDDHTFTVTDEKKGENEKIIIPNI